MDEMRVTWYEARARCRARGGDLVSVSDAGVPRDLTSWVSERISGSMCAVVDGPEQRPLAVGKWYVS